MTTGPITLTESKRFVELEKTIERGKKTFVEVGTALAEIRDSKLYRSDFDNFDEYCKGKWGFTKSYASRLIEAADVVEKLPIGNKINSESQARELTKVEPAHRVEVLEKASAKADAEERPMTARDILESNEPEPPHIETAPPSNDEKWKKSFGGTIPEIFTHEHTVKFEATIADLQGLLAGDYHDKEQLEAIAENLKVCVKAVNKLAKDAK